MSKLKPLVDMSLEDKLAITKVIIERNLRDYEGHCVVSFSGGKDSQLVLYIALSIDPTVPVIFNNTGVEYPETVRFIRELSVAWDFTLVETHPSRTFWDCIQDRGFPKTKNNRSNHKSNICCYHLKEKPNLLAMRSHGWACVFTGVTAPESWQRQMLALTHGTCYTMKNENIHKVHPILYWMDYEVRGYLLARGVQINPLYLHPSGTVDRVGCSTCTAFATWEKQLSAVNPKLYQLVKSRKDALEQKIALGLNGCII